MNSLSKFRKWLIVLPILSWILLSAFMQQDLPDWVNLTSVLVWLAGVGAPAVVGYAMAWVLENWPQWHDFPKWVKFFTPMVLSILISIGAKFLLQSTDMIGLLAPYWTLIIGAILAWVGSQKGYMSAINTGYPPTIRYSTRYDGGKE